MGTFQNQMPGIGVAQFTLESAPLWGNRYHILMPANSVIDSTARDTTNSPTNFLRRGLVLGQLANGDFADYDPTASDGSEIAVGILDENMDIFEINGGAATKTGSIIVAGPVKASELVGLDATARVQLSENFTFDDDFAGAGWGGPLSYITEVSTTSEILTAADSMSERHYTNVAATTPTLPAVGKGMRFRFFRDTIGDLIITSPEGNNIIAQGSTPAGTDNSATTVTTTNVGDVIDVYSNAAGTGWYAVVVQGASVVIA